MLFTTLKRLLLRPDAVLWLLLAGLLLLPVVMVEAISSATVAQMKLQADEISTLATSIRTYYADNVVARVQAANGHAVFAENYRDVHGGVPIPATLAIELGALFDNAHRDGRISYEFVSDYPFARRVSRPLDGFESEAIQAFRRDPSRRVYTQLLGNGLGRSSYRLATPVLMRKACVTCHNSHPDSPRRDWKVGDVRGIQEVTVRALQLPSFGRIGAVMGYVGLLGLLSLGATTVFQRQSQRLERVNRKLTDVYERESRLAERMGEQLQELSLFATAVDNSIVGIAIADMRQPDCPLIYVNEAFCSITGYSRELAVGYNCRFLQGAETDPQELARIRASLRSGSFYSGELINYRHDGTRFWNRLTLSPVGETPGHPDFYVANQVDVTHLKLERGVPLQELNTMMGDLDVVQQALRDANRFIRALQAQLQTLSDSDVAREAYLRSALQAQQTMAERLQHLAVAMGRYRDNG